MEGNAKKMDLKKLLARVRTTRARLKGLVQDGGWMEDARQYLERQGGEFQKLINSDLAKVRVFVERERRELERLQKQIPGEVKRWKKYLGSQRKELEKVLAGVRGATGVKKSRRAAKSSKKKTSSRKTTARRAPSGGASSSQQD